MARKIIHTLIDDLDGTELADGEGRTVTIGYEGKNYEVDLSNDNADKLAEALAPFIKAGRRVTGSNSTPARRSSTGGPKNSPEYLAEVRAWATENGHKVSERGRVPMAVLEAYEAAH